MGQKVPSAKLRRGLTDCDKCPMLISAFSAIYLGFCDSLGTVLLSDMPTLKPDMHDRIWKESGLAKIAIGLGKRKKQKEFARGDYELGSMMSLIKEILGHRYTESHGERWNTCTDLKSLRKVEILGLDCNDIIDLLEISAFPQATQYGNWENAHAKVNALNGPEFKNKLQIHLDSIEQAIKAMQNNWHPELIRLRDSISKYSNPLSDPPSC